MTSLPISNPNRAKVLSMRSVGFKALVAVFLVSLLPIYWIAFHAPAVGIYHDDGIYLVTAKALAEGKGYRIISLPGESPQTKYPILFPAVLAVAWKIFPKFPENALFLKAIPLLFAFLWLWLSFKLVLDETKNPDAALWIVLLTAASSWVVFFSTTIMSETLFACLSAGALIWFKRLEGTRSDEGIGWPLLFSSSLVAASFLTRTLGAPLIAAGTISLFLKRKYLVGGMFLFACAVLIAPWFWWQAVQVDSSRAVDTWYTFSNYKSWNILMNFTAEQKFHVLSINLLSLVFSPMAYLNINANAFGLFVSIILTSLICTGFVRDIREKVRSLHLFMLIYFTIITLWAWPPHRFILPMIPLLLLFAYKEFSRICRRLFTSVAIQNYFSVMLVVLLGIPMIYGLVIRSGETLRRQAVSSFLPSMYEQYDWKVMKEHLDWIRLNTPEDSILLGNLDPMYYLYTGRKAVRGFSTDQYLTYYSEKPETASGAAPSLAQRIVKNRINYIIRTPSSYFKDAEIFNGNLDRLISDYPEALRVVKEGSVPSYKVYEVNHERLLFAHQSRGH